MPARRLHVWTWQSPAPRVFRIVALALLSGTLCRPASAQDRHLFAGGLAGVATLSADAQSVTTASQAALSQYAPENGLAVNLFAGYHLAQYFSVQANWMYNRNDVTLVSSLASPQGGGFYEQRRSSHQHVLDFDGLVYFRRLDSAVRPYLGTGLAIIRFLSPSPGAADSQGLAPPSGEIDETHIGLRSHVGIDVRLSPRLFFRYSFSETIGGNPISAVLTPPAPRRLANFQNLFGLIGRF